MSMANTSGRLTGNTARAAPFLASDEFSFVNGTHLFVYNGYSTI